MRPATLISVLAFAFGFASQALADDKSDGCGPGWWVTKSISFSGTTTRATTNSYFRPFAMTSGTSGCAKHSIVKNDKRSIDYLNTNRELLALEVATGGGEHTLAFAQTLGCDFTHVAPLVDTLRQHHDEVFYESTSAVDMMVQVKGAVRSDMRLAGCRAYRS